MSELQSLHLFINKSILVTNNIHMLDLDINKNSFYTLKKVNEYNTAQMYGMITIYNPNNINFNNSEIMATLIYSPKYSNFVVKSFTIIDKVHKNNKFNKKTYNQSINKRVIDNILNIPL